MIKGRMTDPALLEVSSQPPATAHLQLGINAEALLPPMSTKLREVGGSGMTSVMYMPDIGTNQEKNLK